MRRSHVHVSPIPTPQRRSLHGLLLFLLLSGVASTLHVAAQTPSATEPVFGIGDDEFFIGGWFPPMPNTRTTDNITNRVANATQMLDWAHTMGIGVLRLPIYYGYAPNHQYDFVDTLLSRADTSRHGIRFLVSDFGNADAASYGNEVKFYLVPDSVPFKDWPCRFLHLAGGRTDTNNVKRDDWNHPAVEQLYHRDSVTANLTIADSIVIDWRPQRTSWWSQVQRPGNGWCKVPEENQQRLANQTNAFWAPGLKGADERGSTTYVVVTGHLNELETQADPDSTVLWIDVYYDIGKDEVYFNPLANGGKQVTADWNFSRYCTTLVVRQRDLARHGSESWDEYQEAALPFDATLCNDTTAGPLDPRTGISRRLNLRVRFAGNATVAIRSIALRDATAQAVLGGGADSAARGAAIQAEVSARIGAGNAIHRSVIAIANDGEQAPSQAAAARQVGTWLQDGRTAVNDPRRGGTDSLTVWLDGPIPDGVYDQLSSVQGVGRLTMIMPEFGRTQDSAERWLRETVNDSVAPYGGRKGSIREHNGGRFGLPELVLDRDSIEFFERQVQLRQLRQHVPDAPATFPFPSPMSKPAMLARDQRKRLVAIPFVASDIWINETPFGQLDSGSVGIDRILEPAEIRLIGSIPLAMGARGLLWQILCYGNDYMNGTVRTSGDTLWHALFDNWPIQGKFVDDTADVATPLRFYSQPPDQQNRGDIENIERYAIDTFWTGYGVRRRALQQYNAWLGRVGPELMKLRWRDTYSMHAAQAIPYRRVVDTCGPTVWRNESVPARPLPSTEIITRVTARNPATGLVDPDSATYVELGLFDTQHGKRNVGGTWVSDEMLDTQSVFLVNRRVFEPTDELAHDAHRDSMVALAGTRTIGLKLNLMKFDEFTFCRVREIAADGAPLPGTSVARSALDTIVPADSAVQITLGPGRASLLRITYLPWDTTIIAGRTEHSNQRKIVWDPDQRVFHAVYMKPNDTSRFNKICYRRSKMITGATGSIVWEGVEYVVSETGNVMDSIVFNLHPSLTIRRAPSGAPVVGTAITIVWTGHRVPVMYAARQVLLRTLWSADKVPVVMDQIVEIVDSAYYGQPANRWGTPVVSRLDGSDVVAWSDSLVGIVATARILKNPIGNADWWKAPGAYTDTVIVSGNIMGWEGDDSHGRYPSVPTFAHIRSRDSNIAIVWEQPVAGTLDSNRRSDIYYSRLQHTMSGANDTLIVIDSSFAVINPQAGVNRNPSVSQNQDTWREVQDVVVWESTVSPTNGWPANCVNVRSVFTETRNWNALDQPDLIQPKPGLWGWVASMRRRNGIDWLYPNVASITYRDSTDVRKGLSTIAFRRCLKPATPVEVDELSYQWADIAFKTPRTYTFDGDYPANSETPTEQHTRHALLYQDEESPGTPRLRTSREFFFARGRPVGYFADGRLLSMRMTDSTACGFSLLMADAWTASANASAPVAMTKRDTSLRIIPNLSTATGLLRTRNFAAADSTWIGLTLTATFDGDTTGYWGSHVTYVVELMDSATNARVALLDSFRISTTNREHVVDLVDTLDLLSGSYYVRTTVDTVGVSVPAITNDSRYPVGELQMEILDSMPAFKLRRSPVTGVTDLRVTAHPNPTTSVTEARFTVPTADHVRVIISDYDGRYAVTLLDDWMEPGRYALEIDTRRLIPGVYVVQVHAGTETGIAKVVVSP